MMFEKEDKFVTVDGKLKSEEEKILELEQELIDVE